MSPVYSVEAQLWIFEIISCYLSNLRSRSARVVLQASKPFDGLTGPIAWQQSPFVITLTSGFSDGFYLTISLDGLHARDAFPLAKFSFSLLDFFASSIMLLIRPMVKALSSGPDGKDGLGLNRAASDGWQLPPNIPSVALASASGCAIPKLALCTWILDSAT